MKAIFASIVVFLILMLLMLAGFGEEEEEAMKKLEVRLGFSEIPEDSTCEGKNISPRIEIQGLDAASMVIILDDPDSPSGAFTHWIIWNIEPVSIIPEDIPRNATVESPIVGEQGTNSYGKIGYLGPCPPPGKPHRYVFRVYGLDRMLDIRPGASRKELDAAMKGHIVQQGEAMATYGR